MIGDHPDQPALIVNRRRDKACWRSCTRSIGRKIGQEDLTGLCGHGGAHHLAQSRFSPWPTVLGKIGAEIGFLGDRIDIVEIGIKQENVVVAALEQQVAEIGMQRAVVQIIDRQLVRTIEQQAFASGVWVLRNIGILQQLGRVTLTFERAHGA